MAEKKCVKWLNLIALILIILEIVFPLSFSWGTNFKITSLSVAVLLLAIAAVRSTFGKK